MNRLTKVGLVCALALWLLSSAGCVSSDYERLISEDDVPLLRDLKAAYLASEGATHRIRTMQNGAYPLEVLVKEAGNPDAERIVVMLHGTLSDHETWRFVAGDLAEDFHLLMVDLPGAGASDIPPPESLPPDGYSPQVMADRVCQALAGVLAKQPDRGPQSSRPITILGHSFGGTLALRIAGAEDLRQRHASLVKRIDRLVLEEVFNWGTAPRRDIARASCREPG